MNKYKIDFSQIQQNTMIRSNCNGITFINNGIIDCSINQFPLPAGAVLEIAGDINEMDVTDYNINFVGVTNGNVAILKKIFV